MAARTHPVVPTPETGRFASGHHPNCERRISLPELPKDFAAPQHAAKISRRTSTGCWSVLYPWGLD